MNEMSEIPVSTPGTSARMSELRAEPFALRQPRGQLAAVQHAGAGGGGEHPPPAARAAALRLDLGATISTNSSWCASPALKGQLAPALTSRAPTGCRPPNSSKRSRRWPSTCTSSSRTTGRQLREELFAEDVVIHEADDLTADQVKYLQRLFREEIFPVLTPIAVDPAHPFPFIPNLGFSLAFEMVRPGTTQTLTALVRVPGNLDRFITPAPGADRGGADPRW